ncbi:unnamed protein product [Ambrosiozyma monospora]|uniref:Unnamed protein product n=2 Tax=Ambrosiozyma monospora TaxID=43982 RepID=A0ACB5TCW7_AMBMO|nr:unnamed protein product [Ambrosiozyma monospora]
MDLIEINDPNYQDFAGVENAETITFANKKPEAANDVSKDCHLYIYVKTKDSDLLELNDYPSLTVLNNHKEEVGSNFKSGSQSPAADLELLLQANETLVKDPSHVSEYIDLLKKSKFNSVYFTLNKETSGYRPTILLLKSLLGNLTNELKHSDNQQLTNEVDRLRSQINEWSQLSHYELQSKIAPYLQNTIMNKFTKVSQLIYYSEELSLIISNCIFDAEEEVQTSLLSLTKEKCHGTLVDSASKLNYLEGKIDAILPAETSISSSTYTTNTPLKELKKQVTEVKLPQLQEQVNGLLLSNFGKTTVPVFVITALGDLLNYIDLNTAVAFTALSIALASYNVGKDAYKLMKKFKDWYLDNLRISIDKNLAYLNNKLDDNVKVYGLDLDGKKSHIEKLNEELDKLETVEKALEKTAS